MSHTPGPWHTVGRPNCLGTHTVFYGPGETSANQIGETRRIEDARLIAAAPDLLEACRRAIKSLETFRSIVGDWEQPDQAALDACLAAIARATEPTK